MNENEQITAPVAETNQTAAEISPELLAMMNDNVKADPASQPETLPPLPAQPVLDSERIALTEKVVSDAAGFLFYQAQMLKGRPLGLNDAAAKALAKGVAPCLVKYGIGEPSELFAKWGVEIQAAIAIGTVVFKVWEAERQFKIEQEQAKNMTTADPIGASHGNKSQ